MTFRISWKLTLNNLVILVLIKLKTKKNFPKVRGRYKAWGGRGGRKVIIEEGPESLTCGQLDTVKKTSSSVNHCYSVHLYKHKSSCRFLDQLFLSLNSLFGTYSLKKNRNTVDWLHIKAPFSGSHLLCSLCSKYPNNLKSQKTSNSMSVKLTKHSTYIFQRTVASEDA